MTLPALEDDLHGGSKVTCLWTSAALRTSFTISFWSLSISRFSSDVSRHRWLHTNAGKSWDKRIWRVSKYFTRGSLHDMSHEHEHEPWLLFHSTQAAFQLLRPVNNFFNCHWVHDGGFWIISLLVKLHRSCDDSLVFVRLALPFWIYASGEKLWNRYRGGLCLITDLLLSCNSCLLQSSLLTKTRQCL